MYENRERRDFEIRKNNKIYISNLSSNTSEDELTKVFSKYGSVSSVNLKQKETITFAFVEFGSTAEAEEAINEMDGKELGGQTIKVQFARGGNDRRGGFGDRGRGRPYGDRGGFQNRSGGDYGDRPARRDFGDRPRGCFNCGEEGHMIKDCTKPRKPREFNNNREGGYERRGGYENREGGYERRGGYNNREGGERSYGNRGGYDRDNKRDYGYGSKRKNSSSRSRSRSPKGRRSPSNSSRSR